jgi:hypothetical protein
MSIAALTLPQGGVARTKMKLRRSSGSHVVFPGDPSPAGLWYSSGRRLPSAQVAADTEKQRTACGRGLTPSPARQAKPNDRTRVWSRPKAPTPLIYFFSWRRRGLNGAGAARVESECPLSGVKRTWRIYE